MEKIMSSSSRNVPEDLVIEIMLRLPVKSLLRFKTLSKYWYNLITTSSFIFQHFRINNRTRILTSSYLPRSTSRRLHEIGGFSDLSYESDLSHHRRNLADFRIPFPIEYILGPINGLFLLGAGRSLLHQNYRLALLNPATRELKTLFVPYSNSYFHRFGFGFDPLTNNIKVVAFWNTKQDGLHIDEVNTNMAVYSLANDSWKLLRLNMPNSQCPDYNRNFPDAPYINGSCYWLTKDYSLLSFNFGSDILGEINAPPHVPEYGYTSLFIYNYEFLAMFIGTYANNEIWNQEIDSIDVLVMKEEGCWTKHLTLDLCYLNLLRPIGVWKNKLLLETVDERDYRLVGGVYTTKMAIYNLTTKTIKLDNQSHNYYKDRRVFIYNDSLVPLKGSRNNKSISVLLHDFVYSLHL